MSSTVLGSGSPTRERVTLSPSPLGAAAAIARRELLAYFASPLAYVFGGIFLLATGFLFYLILINTRQADLTPLFNNMAVVFLITVPALSMRLLAEERRQGTIELLMTSPVTDVALVIGKYAAALLYLLFMLATTLIFPLLLAWVGKPDWATVASGYAGAFLLGASFMAIGLLCSSWTSSQMVAMIATFVISLMFWLLPSMAAGVGHADVLQYLSVLSHQENLLRGVIDSTDVFFYLTFIAGCLFLTVRSVELYHWR